MTGKIEIGQAALEVQSGVVRPLLKMAWFGTLLGLIMLVVALWIAIINNHYLHAAAVAFVGALFAVASVPQVAWNHEVRWNHKGIEGPAKMLGLSLGAARTEIAWSDIVRTGRSTTAYWYVEAGDGRRVYFSYLCSYLCAGHEALAQALQYHRPTLRLPTIGFDD